MGGDIPLRVEPDHAERYPGADKLSTEAVLNLLRTTSAMASDLRRRLARHHLTGASFNVLMTLHRAGGSLSPRELADRLVVTPGTVTGLLDTLERQKLLRRVRHPRDGRRLVVELTEEAWPLVEKVGLDYYPGNAELVAGLTERDKQTLIGLLAKIQRSIQPRPE